MVAAENSDYSRKEFFERVFVGLPILSPVAQELTTLEEDLPGFRWATESNLHLTLRFIGQVDEPLKEAIITRLSEIQVEPFILPVEKIGLFPPRGQPQVVYAGVSTAHPRLFQLQHRIEDALASLGLPLELRAFNPHITVARVSRANPQAVHNFVKAHRTFDAPPFKVERFCLYNTHLSHFGATYTPIHDFPLKYKQAKAV